MKATGSAVVRGLLGLYIYRRTYIKKKNPQQHEMLVFHRLVILREVFFFVELLVKIPYQLLFGPVLSYLEIISLKT